MALFEKWNPSRELERFRSEFDDFLEKFGLEGRLFKEREQTLRPAVEAYVEDDTFRVRVDLPGIDSANIDVKVTGGTLTIKGSREQKHDTTKQDYFQREIRYGSFERSISMPEGIKAEDLKASYRDGVLELAAPMPKQATSAGVKIEVKRTHAKD
jgi:HSP20 family protein